MNDGKQEWLQEFLKFCNASKTTGFDLVGVCETFVPKRIIPYLNEAELRQVQVLS